MQQGLSQWKTFLKDKTLPILPRTKKDVQALIDQPQLSITQYTAPIFFDAGFSAHVFKYVNTQRETSGKNPLTTMSNVLSHLGQASFQNFLKKTPLLETISLPEKNRQGYLRVMGQACHAALQSSEWAQQRNANASEETQLATLLQKITELMLWCYGDDVMPKIEELCYVKKNTYEQAAKKVLGCGMRELGGELAKAWNLPEMATHGLCLKQDDFTLATGVSLASEMARIVDVNWYGKEAEKIITRIAKYKGKAEAEIERRLHLNAVNVNDVLLSKGYAAPAKLLLQLADDKYEYAEFILNVNENKEDKEKPKMVSAEDRSAMLKEIKARKAAIKKSEEKQATKREVIIPKNPKTEKLLTDKKASEKSVLVKAAVENKTLPPVSKELALSIKEFKLMVSQAKPAHDLIEKAVKTCLLCGVQRCVFMVKLPKKEWLVSRYAAQASDDIAINKLKIPIDKPHVFKLLMEKSRGLFLNESNAMKYWKMIPETVKLAIGVRQFFAMSVFVNNHAMGLMYADKLKGDLKQSEYVQFQAVCRLLSKGIVQSTKNKKSKIG